MLVQSPNLLVVEYIRSCVVAAISAGFLVCSFLIPAWSVLQKTFPDVNVTVSLLGLPAPNAKDQLFIALGSMLVGLMLWPKVLGRFRVCEDARSKLVKSAQNHTRSELNQE